MDSAEIPMRGDVFFSDKIDGNGALVFDAIAGADADQNGDVSMEELAGVTLESARAKGLYDVAGRTEVVDLAAFVNALAGSALASFRAQGKCTPGPVAAEP
jgi:hypothetical protein